MKTEKILLLWDMVVSLYTTSNKVHIPMDRQKKVKK